MSSATCRICLQKSDEVVEIFCEGFSRLYKKFRSLTKIDISPNDGLPTTICLKCNKELKRCIEFLTKWLESDLHLKLLLHKSSKDTEENYCEVGNNSEVNEECNTSVCSNSINRNEAKRKDGSKNLTNLQCCICGKVMSSSFRLKTHLATHSQEKAFSCQFCEKKFSIQQNLKVHLRIHMGQKPHQCSICGEKFAQSSGLSVHKRKHSGVLPYTCNICPRSFRTIGHLQYHIRSHTGEKLNECTICERSFISKGDLKAHAMTHTGEKPHICSVCGMQFSRAANLRRHSKHTHKKTEYLCTQCKLEFPSKSDMEKHSCDARNNVKL